MSCAYVCSVEGCDGSSFWKDGGTKGWCRAHYKKFRKYGDPLLGAGRVDNSGECLVDGCSKKSKSLGLCNSHYLRFRASGDVSGSGKALRGEPKSFFDRSKSFEADECLIWPYSRNKSGYATMFAKKGQTTIVSRMMCEAIHGPPQSEDMDAAHSCGMGHMGCMSPKHISWKPKVENSNDKKAHGTFYKKSHGSSHMSAKLTENDVKAIRANRGASTAKAVAQQYCVTEGAIKAIYARKTWKHVE